MYGPSAPCHYKLGRKGEVKSLKYSSEQKQFDKTDKNYNSEERTGNQWLLFKAIYKEKGNITVEWIVLKQSRLAEADGLRWIGYSRKESSKKKELI